MPSQVELLLEAERRGILPKDKKALLSEARKRGLVPAAGVIPGNETTPPRKATAQVPAYVPDGQGGEIALRSEDAQAELARAEMEGQAEQKAKEARIGKRGIGDRVLGTANFAFGLPIRIATGGQYGISDAFGLLNKNAGQNAARSEQEFIEANEGGLNALKVAGDIAAGIPALNTMGAPLARGVAGAVGAYAKASPTATKAAAIRGLGETVEAASRDPRALAKNILTGVGDNAGAIAARPIMSGADRNIGARMGRGLQSYADNMQPRQSKAGAPQVSQTPIPENIQSLPERLADIEAFRALGLKPFGPATGSKGTARAAKTIEDLPIIGGTVGSPKADVQLGLERVQGEMASQLGGAGGQEAVGATVQRGLERYRTAGVDKIDPNTLRGSPIGPVGPQRPMGIEPYQPVKRAQNLTGPAIERADEAAPLRTAGGGGTAQTGRGATVAAARPLDQIGLRRTNVSDLSKSELDRLVKTPSTQTSFATRAEALYERAWKRVPEFMKSDEKANPNQIGWKNLQDTLKGINRQTANQISGQGTLGGDLAQRIMTPRSHTNLAELRSIRTELGRSLSNFGHFDTSLARSQLKSLYAAAYKDMEAGLTDLSNRAWIRTTATDKSKISVAKAREADAALYEFRRADRYYRQGMERMDRAMNVLEAKTPNEAVRKITTALKEKTANPQMLRSLSGILRPEELNALRGHIIESLGKGRAGAAQSEAGFNINTWATDYAAIMDGPGREFMTKGLPEGVAKKLENMARVVNRMKYYETTKNFSGSGLTGILGAGAIAMTSLDGLATLGMATAGTAGVGKLLTSRAYLNWQEALMKAQLKAGNTSASNVRIASQYAKRLPALANGAKSDPDLRAALLAYHQSMQQELGKEKARISAGR